MILPALDMHTVQVPFFQKAHHEEWMTDYERAVIIACLRKVNAETVIEIGVQQGHCAFEILKHLPIKRYIGIDLSPHSAHQPRIAAQRSEVPHDKVAEVVRDNPIFQLMTRARGSLDFRVGGLPTCDAFIIDGDHTKDAVWHDSMLATAATRDGGVIIWHDYEDWDGCGVPDVLHMLHAVHRDVRQVENTMLAVEFR